MVQREVSAALLAGLHCFGRRFILSVNNVIGVSFTFNGLILDVTIRFCIHDDNRLSGAHVLLPRSASESTISQFYGAHRCFFVSQLTYWKRSVFDVSISFIFPFVVGSGVFDGFSRIYRLFPIVSAET